MDRRAEPRFSIDVSARVTLLAEPPVTVEGRIVNASGRGLRIEVGSPVPASIPVRVDVGDSVLLGETCYCAPEGGHYSVGLQLDQILAEVSELARHVDGLLRRGDALTSCASGPSVPAARPIG